MKRMNLKRKIAAMMCAMMTFSCAVPAAFAEDLVTLLTPEETKALFDSYKALQDQMESAAAALSGESAQQENPGDQDTAQDTQKKQETAFLSSGPVFNEFTLSAKEKDGTITVTLAGNSPYEIEVVLSGAASAKDWILDTNGSVSFSGLSAGDYTIKASYVSKPSISAGASVKIEAADEDDGNSGGAQHFHVIVTIAHGDNVVVGNVKAALQKVHGRCLAQALAENLGIGGMADDAQPLLQLFGGLLRDRFGKADFADAAGGKAFLHILHAGDRRTVFSPMGSDMLGEIVKKKLLTLKHKAGANFAGNLHGVGYFFA